MCTPRASDAETYVQLKVLGKFLESSWKVLGKFLERKVPEW
jgi:hypothetical protein